MTLLLKRPESPYRGKPLSFIETPSTHLSVVPVQKTPSNTLFSCGRPCTLSGPWFLCTIFRTFNRSYHFYTISLCPCVYVTLDVLLPQPVEGGGLRFRRLRLCQKKTISRLLYRCHVSQTPDFIIGLEEPVALSTCSSKRVESLLKCLGTRDGVFLYLFLTSFEIHPPFEKKGISIRERRILVSDFFPNSNGPDWK